MAWFVHFIPNECDSISVLVNNEYWTRWFKTAGDTTIPLPPRFQGMGGLKVGATVSPEGKNGSIEVKWDGRVIKRYDFDNYEDHDLNNAPPDPGHEHGGHGGGGGRGGNRLLEHTGSHPDTEASSGSYGEGAMENHRTLPADITVFSSGVLTNKSGPPVSGARTSVNVPVGKEFVAAAAETKTFRTWMMGGGPVQTGQDEKWILRSSSKTDLAAIYTISVTLLRAPDPQTGVLFVQATFGFRQTSLGWHVPFAEKGGLRVRIWFLNAVDGVLEEWEVATNQIIKCDDNGTYYEFKKNVTPDWYDIVAAALVILDPNTWYRC